MSENCKGNGDGEKLLDDTTYETRDCRLVRRVIKMFLMMVICEFILNEFLIEKVDYLCDTIS